MERVNSPEWYQWISENWAEELYRRRMNYTVPYYQTEGNVCWIKTTDWIFKRKEYEKMVDSYWDIQVLSRIEEFDDRKLLYKEGWAKFIASLTRDGRTLLEQHIKDYDGILLHLLAGDLIVIPLFDLLKNHLSHKRKIQIYCKAVECMWRYGNEEVVNIVEVTILEYLSSDENVWKEFGKNISNEFIKFINGMDFTAKKIDEIRGKNELGRKNED